MAVDLRRWLLLLFGATLIGGCAPTTPTLSYLALLAPFEGRYREVGYDLLYAARLGLADAEQPYIELLPVDDGGTVEEAAARARALARNPLVLAVLVAGPTATQAEPLAALDNLPTVVVGLWNATPGDGEARDPDLFILAGADLRDQYTASAIIDIEAAVTAAAPLVGGELFALKQFPPLRDDLTGVVVASNAAPPDETFRARLLASGQFVEAPGLLVALAYDAARLTAGALGADTPSRRIARDRISAVEYAGLNGAIRFAEGYWANAPTVRYVYDEAGALTVAP
jgi:hypothetical protein